MVLIDGKKVSAEVGACRAKEVKELKEKNRKGSWFGDGISWR